MSLRYPIILAPPNTKPAYRWRLVTATYDSGRAVIEATVALTVMLVIAAVRTHTVAFAVLAAVTVVITSARVWDNQQFRRAAAAKGGMPGTPEGWMRRHAAGAIAFAAVWGAQDVGVLLLTADAELQLVVLMLQSAWVAATCVRMAASPAAVIWQIILTLGTSLVCLALMPNGLLKLVSLTLLLQITGMWRISRALGRLLLEHVQSAEHLESINAQLSEANAKLRRLSVIDGLTGITNRRGFDEALEAEWSRACREDGQLALLLIDVDHFKLYNDRYGHLLGDDCLRAIAMCVSNSLSRPTDLAARYGGEEFVALLAVTSYEGALHVAEHIRASVAAANMAHDLSPFGHVSVSIGVASVAADAAEDQHSLIRLADLALYEAKRRGRNRVHAGPIACVAPAAATQCGAAAVLRAHHG